MLWYIVQRAFSAITVVFLTLIASFGLFFVAPSDPAGVICGPRCNPEREADIIRSLRLDEPVVTQVTGYISGIFQGRTIVNGGVTVECAAPCLGYSYQFGQPVTELVGQALPVTLSIVLGAAVVYLAVGVFAGTFAARFRGTFIDRAVVIITQTLGAIPYFIVALLVALYATFLPEPGYVSILENPLAWASGLLAAWMTLGIVNSAGFARFSRASMIESMGEDYIRTARAKGLTERRVAYRHGLRASITPVVTIFGIGLAFQIGGAIFTESIFGLPGLGLLTIRAFGSSDLPVLMASTLVGTIALVTMNLLVDIAYTVLDPRVRLR